MPDAHDGPISEGIRDAIRASGMTPYAIAKEVTRRGNVKLTGPQIYRFLKGDKGLSLAILDEIASVLHLNVIVVPPEERKAEGSPHRIVLQEALDRLSALATNDSMTAEERIWRLDSLHRGIRDEKRIRGDEIHTLYGHYSSLRDQLVKQRDAEKASKPRMPKAGLCPPGMAPVGRRRPPLEIDDDDEDVDGDEDNEEWFN